MTALTTERTYAQYTFRRWWDKFVAALVSSDGGTTKVDADKVAWTTTDEPPQSRDDTAWQTPVPGVVNATPRVGAMTGTLAGGTRYYLWGLPPDTDEYVPVLCAVVYME